MERNIGDVDKKAPGISALVTTTVLHTKIGEVESKIQNVSGLVTTVAFNTKIGEVENKIHDVSGLVNKTNHNSKISDIEIKYFTTSDYNKSTSEILETKIKEKRLVDNPSISNLVKKYYFKLKTLNISNKSRIKSRAR